MTNSSWRNGRNSNYSRAQKVNAPSVELITIPVHTGPELIVSFSGAQCRYVMEQLFRLHEQVVEPINFSRTACLTFPHRNSPSIVHGIVGVARVTTVLLPRLLDVVRDAGLGWIRRFVVSSGSATRVNGARLN